MRLKSPPSGLPQPGRFHMPVAPSTPGFNVFHAST
jgi:hypothetical protein